LHVHTFTDTGGAQRVTSNAADCDQCTLTPAADLRARWLPSDSAVRHARALLDAEPRADLAAIPMVQPGKNAGIWTAGQEVQTVPGAVFIGVNAFDVDDGAEVPSYSWARDAAAAVARTVLGDRKGTVAWATVDRDGHVGVFEDSGRRS
jgi:hypothetical protein